ncbi:MAG: alpha/beta fold hydrolase [Bacteroidia bacterium]|nr:alpha/beta fold hydrolase [Bacteroidia bacterium]NND24397.1 alpha/beta fold hydrolase [Flavobacteriaceae bacterium]NNK59878.1 alpha/beta fold hydrolase [Flavobacteriaceae bacterium]NNL31747.1 alpha/beta fold hydrolase [Flavobacteriaceae bacterium]RZW57054.1 MAG: alpha/beta fold hydrolase [Flavobacteriaceae bacterium]
MLLHSNILGSGRPLIILHGFLGMSDNWKTLGKRFAEHNFEVHLIDQRNHGRSYHDDTFNYEVMSADLEAYVKHHQLEASIVLGHSMGGKTAMLFACLNPDLVSKLIVADIAPRFYPTHHEAILEGLSSLDFDEIGSRSEADDFLANYVSDFGTRQFLLKNLYWIEKGKLGLRINLKILKAQVEEVGEALPKHLVFHKESLFLRGDRSEYISANDEPLIRLQFPNSKIETIEKAGHWLHAENPQAFFEEVLKFID